MKVKKYYIFDHEVDRKTYEKYENMEFDINGQIKPLYVVGFWAQSEEIAEYCPEDAAEAKRIYNEILRDIGAVGAVDTSKHKRKTFAEYIDALNDIYKSHFSKYKKLVEMVETAEQELNDVFNGTPSENDRAIARGEYAQASIEFERGLRELQDSYTVQVREVRQELESLITDVYRVTPDKIDAPSVDLINSGIMSVSDLDYMATQFRHNPAMLKLIAKHCVEFARELRTRGQNDNAVRASALARALEPAEQPEKVFEGFDMLAKRGEQGLAKNALRSVDAYWDTMYGSIRKHYEDYIIQADTSYKRA